MAKQKRALPQQRKPRDRSRDEESLLLRSAESLGRMIGALQRQLDGATKRLAQASEAWESTPSLLDEKATRRGATKRSAKKKSAGAKNTASAADKKKKSAAKKSTRRQ